MWCAWPNTTSQTISDRWPKCITSCPSPQISQSMMHMPLLTGLSDGHMFLTISQAFTHLKAVPTYFMHVSKFMTQDTSSKKLMICIQHIDSWIDTCMPLSNPRQCTVPQGGALSSRVSGEYLSNKVQVRIRPFMQHYVLITCSTIPGVHWPLVFCPDLQIAPKVNCKTAQSL